MIKFKLNLKSKKFKVQYIHYNEKFDIKDYTLFDPIDKLKLENNYTLLVNDIVDNVYIHNSIYNEKLKNQYDIKFPQYM